MIYTVCWLHLEIEMIQVTKMSEMQQLIKLIIWLKLVTKTNQSKSLELVSVAASTHFSMKVIGCIFQIGFDMFF